MPNSTQGPGDAKEKMHGFYRFGPESKRREKHIQITLMAGTKKAKRSPDHSWYSINADFFLFNYFKI